MQVVVYMCSIISSNTHTSWLDHLPGVKNYFIVAIHQCVTFSICIKLRFKFCSINCNDILRSIGTVGRKSMTCTAHGETTHIHNYKCIRTVLKGQKLDPLEQTRATVSTVAMKSTANTYMHDSLHTHTHTHVKPCFNRSRAITTNPL